MDEDLTQPNASTTPAEDDRSIWEILGVTPPGEDDEDEEPFVAEAEEAEAAAEKQDKLSRKLTARVDDLQKKFDATQLAGAKEKFMAAASPLEQDLFKAVAADVRDMEALARVAEMVKGKAKSMEAQLSEYEEERKVEAAAQAHRAWGLGGSPIGGSPAPSAPQNEVKELLEKGDIAAASRASMKVMFEGDRMLGGMFG